MDKLSTAITLCLGMSLMYIYTHQKAVALPTSSDGYGQNPLVSIGGTAYSGETKLLFTAPSDQDIIVTDLVLSSYSPMTCKRNHKSEIILSSGGILGQFETHSSISRGSYSSSGGLSIQHAFSSGLRIPAGDSLTIVVTETGVDGGGCGGSSSYGVRYMFSGYHAQM